MQFSRQLARNGHHGYKGGGGDHLQEELLLFGQTLVVAAEELEVVIHEADGGVSQTVQADQSHGDQLKGPVGAVGQHEVDTEGQHDRQEGGDEGDTAHGGGACLGLVGGDVLVDGLSRLLGAEDGERDTPEEQGQPEGGRRHDTQDDVKIGLIKLVHTVFLSFSCVFFEFVQVLIPAVSASTMVSRAMDRLALNRT